MYFPLHLYCEMHVLILNGESINLYLYSMCVKEEVKHTSTHTHTHKLVVVERLFSLLPLETTCPSAATHLCASGSDIITYERTDMAMPLSQTVQSSWDERTNAIATMSLNWSGKDHKNSNQPAAGGQKRSRSDCGNKVTVVLGAQWGDEGKGKVVDLLATEADLVCRCQVNGWCSGYRVGVTFFPLFRWLISPRRD